MDSQSQEVPKSELCKIRVIGKAKRNKKHYYVCNLHYKDGTTEKREMPVLLLVRLGVIDNLNQLKKAEKWLNKKENKRFLLRYV